MEFERILIRYGELSTKGKNRKRFVAVLAKNVKRVVKDFKEVKVHGERDRMQLYLNGADHKAVLLRLTSVFGIQSFSPVVKTDLSLDQIKEAATQLVKDSHQKDGTFKVAARRSNHSFELDSNELNQEIGAHVLREIPDLSVNVKNPDVKLNIDVRQDGVFLSCEQIKGSGGLPVGSSGRAMLMLSGGIDSPVAGYLAMKRGVEIEAVHFHSPPYTSEQAKQKAIDLARKLTNYSGQIQMNIVPFTEIQEAIKKQIPESYIMTVTRRLMMQITDQIRAKRNGLAIVNGESLGQVASQTLESMVAINAVTNTPIIRPVVSMDKNEIIEIAQRIDTFELSIQPFEDCCTIFTPSAPKTKPKLEKVEYYESFIDFESLLQKAIENTVTFSVEMTQNQEIKDEFADLF
ncbi:tRNA uracil 4-sulfurtransferase ThiI [Listeria sp. PSOL-1]|uniref:tRNA uracil 4-sulfurtransferase ThiI n=1 Tax=Listeria sp. PSOL-1 TaxID=1844999 RepID=UPI0013CFF4BA|nr:tRNA uracil 4-sulfurtransferase ThiI [Listeria sp. PSOL-1]